MMRIDYLIFGYRIFTLADKDVGVAADIFLKSGISVRFKKNSFAVPERRVRRTESVLAEKIEYSKTDMLGFFGFLHRNRKRYGVFFAILFTMLVLAFFSDRVWDVRI